MKDILALIIFWGYILVGVFTYGHSLNSICGHYGEDDKKLNCIVGASVSGAAISTLLWPLYWSYKLQEQTK